VVFGVHACCIPSAQRDSQHFQALSLKRAYLTPDENVADLRVLVD